MQKRKQQSTGGKPLIQRCLGADALTRRLATTGLAKIHERLWGLEERIARLEAHRPVGIPDIEKSSEVVGAR
jgi:hypothetical protein